MKTYVYPAVLMNEEDGCYISIPDLGLLCCGDSKEEAYVKGKDSLLSYVELAQRFETDIPEPSEFDAVKAKNPGKDVIMLDVSVNSEEVIETNGDEEYRKFMKLFFDEGN